MSERPRRRKLSTKQPAQDQPLPPPGMATTLCARCGGHYLDYPAGRDAHNTALGHPPATKAGQP